MPRSGLTIFHAANGIRAVRQKHKPAVRLLIKAKFSEYKN
jgi:hypothetical protein